MAFCLSFQKIDNGKAFLAKLDAIDAEVQARVSAKGNALAGHGATSTAAPPATTGPAPGTVEEGYRFKGGDPADPASWEPVQ